jgi:hypothetical protein
MDKLVLVDTHANPDIQRDSLAPDISVYASDNVPDADGKTDFSMMELFVELKFAETSDPFRDPKDPLRPQAENFRFENDSDVSRLNRGQLCSYAAAHVGSQFRVHTFTLSICGKSARFIRWDRGGATVTRSFDYIKEPHILAHFFWRYAHLNHSQRGYDTSVSPASPEDLQQIQHVEKHLRDENPAHREFCIITVPDRDDPKFETPFIISFPPKYTTRSPFGRATRPMLAFNMETSEVVFSEGLLESGCGQYGEGRRNLCDTGIKGCSKYRAFWKGERCQRSHDPNAYTEKREVGLLVERNGAPRTIQDVSESRRSAFDFVQLLMGVRECNC